MKKLFLILGLALSCTSAYSMQQEPEAIELKDWSAHFHIGHHMICEGRGYDFEYYSEEYARLGYEIVVNKKDISTEELNEYLTKHTSDKKISSLNLYQCTNLDFNKIHWGLLLSLRELVLVETNITYISLTGILRPYISNSRSEHYDLRVFLPEPSSNGMSEKEIQNIDSYFRYLGLNGINSPKAICRSNRRRQSHREGLPEWFKKKISGYHDWPQCNKRRY